MQRPLSYLHPLPWFVLLAMLWLGGHVRGEDLPTQVNAIEMIDYPQVDTSALFFDAKLETLMPWIERYHSIGPDFAKRNELAFRLARRRYGWPARMSLVMSDQRTSVRTKLAVVHYASACYTDAANLGEWHRSLTGGDDVRQVIAGTLMILRSSRALKPDGSDSSWPASGLIDPQGMPQRIIRVLNEHPELALDVILTLDAYGSLALKEAEGIIPLLLSRDTIVSIAAQTAILKMDPHGIAKLLNLNGKPLTHRQIEMVRQHYAFEQSRMIPTQVVYDSRESDGSPQSETSRMRQELQRVLRFQSMHSVIGSEKYLNQQDLGHYFRDQGLPGDWWRLVSREYCSNEHVFSTDDPIQLLQIASALYTKPGARESMLRVLHSDDPGVASAMVELLHNMRLYKVGITKYSDGDLVDPQLIPNELLKVAQRHPHLKVKVAGCLSVYKSLEAPHLDLIVPLLLTDDTHEMQAVRSWITLISPDLADRLEIAYVYSRSANSEEFMRESREDVSVDGAQPLTPRQRKLIENYIKSR